MVCSFLLCRCAAFLCTFLLRTRCGQVVSTNQSARPGIQNSPDRREHVGYDRYAPMTWSVGSVSLHGKREIYLACDPSSDSSDVSRSTKLPETGEMEGAFGSALEAIFTLLHSVYFYHLSVQQSFRSTRATSSGLPNRNNCVWMHPIRA